MRAYRILAVVVLASSVFSSCASKVGLRCVDQERYLGSEETPPVQIPDDLTPPDESQSLRIPAPVEEGAVEQIQSTGACLESPPEFFDEGAPG